MKAILIGLVASLPFPLLQVGSAARPGVTEASHSASLEPDAPARFEAYVRGEGRCGFAGSGRQAYVVNRLSDRRVRVTVRTSWKRGIDSGQSQRSYVLAAGGERSLGCTMSNNVGATRYTFEVIGCEVL